jgi:hypothetical protein
MRHRIGISLTPNTFLVQARFRRSRDFDAAEVSTPGEVSTQPRFQRSRDFDAWRGFDAAEISTPGEVSTQASCAAASRVVDRRAILPGPAGHRVGHPRLKCDFCTPISQSLRFALTAEEAELASAPPAMQRRSLPASSSLSHCGIAIILPEIASAVEGTRQMLYAMRGTA